MVDNEVIHKVLVFLWCYRLIHGILHDYILTRKLLLTLLLWEILVMIQKMLDPVLGIAQLMMYEVFVELGNALCSGRLLGRLIELSLVEYYVANEYDFVLGWHPHAINARGLVPHKVTKSTTWFQLHALLGILLCLLILVEVVAFAAVGSKVANDRLDRSRDLFFLENFDMKYLVR